MTIDLGWVDIALAAFLLLSVVVGLSRGFVFELLSLVGWFAAYFAALYLTPMFQAQVPIGARGSSLNHGVTFACVFLVVLVVWSLAAKLVRALLHATPLSAFDRLLGGAFGFVRGMLVLLVLVTLVAVSPWGRSAAWQRSQGVLWLNAVLQELRPFLPGDLSPRQQTA